MPREELHRAPAEFECRGFAALERMAAVLARRHRAGRVIPRDYITQWWDQAPWREDFQVGQDLIISRALFEIFTDPAPARAISTDCIDEFLAFQRKARKSPLTRNHSPGYA